MDCSLCVSFLLPLLIKCPLLPSKLSIEFIRLLNALCNPVYGPIVYIMQDSEKKTYKSQEPSEAIFAVYYVKVSEIESQII